jgi:HAUS augmin-like complex subunit 2
MNPWEYTKPGAGNVLGYLQLIQSNPEPTRDELIQTQTEIFKAMDNYFDLSIRLKEDQDLTKVGDFIDLSQIKAKTKSLQKISKHLKKINQNKAVFSSKIPQTTPGNELYVEQEFQIQFFKLIEVIKDSSMLEIVNQSSKLHPKTKTTLTEALSKDFVSISKSIIDDVQYQDRQLQSIRAKYN